MGDEDTGAEIERLRARVEELEEENDRLGTDLDSSYQYVGKIEAAEARAEKAEEDARRLDWFEEEYEGLPRIDIVMSLWWEGEGPNPSVRQAIDAAMAREQGKG